MSSSEQQSPYMCQLAFVVVLCVLYASAGLIVKAPMTHLSNPRGPPSSGEKFSRAFCSETHTFPV